MAAMGEAAPPLFGLGAPTELPEEEQLSLDEQFGQVLYALMRDDISAAEAVVAFERSTAGITQQYRNASSALLHRAAHYLHMRSLASELESQGASWQLLQALYCCGDSPAGAGIAGATDAGGRQTLRQLSADLVNSSGDLRRCAQVVAWLESLAARRLEEAPPARFAQHDGLWRETLLSAGVGRQGAAELDPDAPSRGGIKLALGDRQGEERLAAQLWQLIRAGKVKEGRQLCCQAGQAWRCLSLAGGGEWGPMPVGAPADDAAEQLDQQAAADDLSWQVEGGLAAGRVAWRFACYAAAEAAANAAPGNRWEAAVYGALCGHAARGLPVCSSWEDEAWVYCRAWLDLAVDALLLESVEQGQPGAREALLGAGGEDTVPPELLAGCVVQAAASGYSSAASAEVLDLGLEAAAGGWPLQRLLADAERICIPRNFFELAQLINGSPNAAVRVAAKQQQRVLQLLLMTEDWTSLTLELAGAALSAAEQLQQLAQRGGGGGGGGGGSEDGSAAAMDEEEGAEDEEGAAMSAESAAGVLRFAAHWALALRALGLLPHHSWLGDNQEDEAEMARLQTVLSKVIYQHALQLAGCPDTLHLAPLYLCHLRQGQRESLAEALLANATDLADDAACQALYLQLAAATEGWAERQHRLDALVVGAGRQPGPWWDEAPGAAGDTDEAARPPSSCLFGDLRAEELRLLLQQLTARAFASTSASPLQRCRQLRWLFYPFTAALAEQEAAAAAAAPAPPEAPSLLWQPAWGDALACSVALAGEMALNRRFGSAGLQAVVVDVVPAGFVAAAGHAAAEQLGGAAQLQVQRQLLALAFWQRYAELDAQYQQWRQAWAAVLAGAPGAPDDAGAAAATGEALAAELLALAREDCLRLAAPAGLAQLLGVEEGEWLLLPKYDAAEEKPNELLLAVTATRDAGDAGGDDPDLPFVQLEPHRAARLERQLSHFLYAATRSMADVTAETAVADPAAEGSPAGTVLVKLTSFAGQAEPGAHDVDRARLHRRMTAAWEGMAALAARLLGAGGAAAAAGEGDPALPRLALVHMEGSLSARLAICRRRTASKLLRRSSKVLLDLARTGHPSPQLDALIAAAGDADGAEGPQLLGLLAPSDTGKLLVLLEQAVEEGGLLGGEAGDLQAGREQE